MGRIVHFGLGNFARAHLLDYTADAGGWDVVGVSLRSPTVRDGLVVQGFAYDLCVQGQGVKRIDVIHDVLVASEDPKVVLNAMAKAEIISVTVTEKGYHLDASGLLDLEDPDIGADLVGQGPSTLIGFLAHGLVGRQMPVTVLSCDNRVENGTALARAVKRFAQAAGLVIDWGIVRFPNAMVDRITPATTANVRAISGDPMAVPTEAFREWVIEDDFAGPRPDWPDVQFVSDVAPHELRKLRMLNGAHSLIAYAGLACGHVFVNQAIADVELRAWVVSLMQEAATTLPTEVRGEALAYAKALVVRFENPELMHRLDQIAMDGSQKVPYRFIATLRDADGNAPAVIKGIQAWVDFCISETAMGKVLNDPNAKALMDAARGKDPLMKILSLVDAADLAPLIRV